MTEEKRAQRQASLSRVASGVQLEEVRLRYMTSILGISVPENLPEDWSSRVKLSHEADVISTENDSDEPLGIETTDFVVSITFSAEYGLVESGENEENLDENDDEGVPTPDVGIFAMYELRYSLANGDEVSSHDLHVFAKVNSVFNCWPYWRELAHSITQRMNLATPLLVPVKTVNALEIKN